MLLGIPMDKDFSLYKFFKPIVDHASHLPKKLFIIQNYNLRRQLTDSRKCHSLAQYGIKAQLVSTDPVTTTFPVLGGSSLSMLLSTNQTLSSPLTLPIKEKKIFKIK